MRFFFKGQRESQVSVEPQGKTFVDSGSWHLKETEKKFNDVCEQGNHRVMRGTSPETSVCEMHH